MQILQQFSVTLFSVIIAIFVCNYLNVNTLKLQQISLITKFTDTYNSSNSRYIKRELNSCKGETQHIPALSKGEVRRGCSCQQIAWKRLKAHWETNQYGSMGIISYPEFAQYLATAWQVLTAFIAHLKKYFYLYRYNTASGWDAVSLRTKTNRTLRKTLSH